jgi:hypothetical protein
VAESGWEWVGELGWAEAALQSALQWAEEEPEAQLA